MKTVPLNDLKKHMSALLAEAEDGEQILVTRHGRPVARIVPAGEQHIAVGDRFGKGALRPLFTRPATRGRYLTTLEADRRDEKDPA